MMEPPRMVWMVELIDGGERKERGGDGVLLFASADRVSIRVVMVARS